MNDTENNFRPSFWVNLCLIESPYYVTHQDSVSVSPLLRSWTFVCVLSFLSSGRHPPLQQFVCPTSLSLPVLCLRSRHSLHVKSCSVVTKCHQSFLQSHFCRLHCLRRLFQYKNITLMAKQTLFPIFHTCNLFFNAITLIFRYNGSLTPIAE